LPTRCERPENAANPARTGPDEVQRIGPEEDLRGIIASGDTVATRWVVKGSLQQEFMGIPLAGQTIEVEGMTSIASQKAA